MLICKHCNSETDKNGKPWKNQGALNLHQYRCSENPDRKGNIENVNQTKEEKDALCPQCGTELKFLNPDYEYHRQAIDGGYNLICPHCTWIVK